MNVLKFGGKSLGNKEKICKIAKYIKSRCKNEKLIVVVSAIADTTDRLIKLSKNYAKKPNSRELDVLLSCGETVSASLLAMKLCALGVKACSLLGWQAGIMVEGNFNEGIISQIDKKPIEEKLLSYDCIVVTGFQGVNEDGDILTIGRGGSDTSAVALGAVFEAKVEIFSDFDGIFAGDPRRDRYKKYKEVDYDSAFLYAESGAKVLSKSSTEIAKESNVNLVCKSSAEPHLSGTKIVKLPKPFIGISVKQNLCEINLISNTSDTRKLKTLKYLLEKVKFYKIEINKDKISVLLDQNSLNTVEHNIAKINEIIYSRGC